MSSLSSFSSFAQCLSQARTAEAEGRFTEAEALCQDVLALSPEHPDALWCWGLALRGQRQFAAAASAFQRAVNAGQTPVAAEWRNFAEVLLALGLGENAAQALQQALSLSDDDAATWLAIARMFVATDRPEQGLAAARRAYALMSPNPDATRVAAMAMLHLQETGQAEAIAGGLLSEFPNDPDALLVIAASRLQQGQVEEADTLVGHAIAGNPELADAYALQAQISLRLGRLDDAFHQAHQALVRKPGLAAAFIALGHILRRQGRTEEAIPYFRQALHLRPQAAEVHASLGAVLAERYRLGEAEATLKTALGLKPAHAPTHSALARVHFQQGRLDAALAGFRRALVLQPDLSEACSNLLMALNYDPNTDDDALRQAHQDWDLRFGQPATPLLHTPPHANVRDPQRRLRVGYVSPDFGRHPVGYFLEAVLAAHDPAQVESFAYSDRHFGDDLTTRLHQLAHVHRPIAGLSDAALAGQIRADGIDLLIDLSGHTGGNRLPLFALRPAPVQISWLGYFNTTGLAAMDYVLMDPHAVPDGAEGLFCETVLRLPQGRFCYSPPDYAPEPAPPPCHRRGGVTFGCFNNLTKITPAVVRLWTAVLAAVPDSRLLLKWHSLDDPDVRDTTLHTFTEAGLAPQRLELRGRSPHPEMLAEYADIDIALDPFPFCGGLTSCEALWMGVPVVTLPGRRPVSRQTLSYLAALDLAVLAADSPERYAQLAVSLARQPETLTHLRASLRDRMRASPLCDGPGFTRSLETIYRQVWQHWCAGAAG